MKVLIIRSTSIQHLALVIRAVRARYSSAGIDCLTHPHALESVREMPEIDKVCPYPSSRDFSPLVLPASRRNHYAAVIVPVSNMTGAGFENVLLLARRLSPGKITLCNLRGALIPVARRDILTRVLRQFAAAPLAVGCALAFVAVNTVLLIIFRVLGRGSLPFVKMQNGESPRNEGKEQR